MEGTIGGLFASGVAALGTALGATTLLIRRDWSPTQQSRLLAAAAGVMLGATFFSLILPALDSLQSEHGTVWGTLWVALLIGVGAASVGLLNQVVPHQHPVKGREGPEDAGLSGPTLFVLAISLHNLPEGLSVGVASASDFSAGLPVLLGITAQNLPEGFAVAAALLGDGSCRSAAVGIGALTGLAEVLGGTIGALVVGVGTAVVPFAYAFAAGAMLFVISGEVIPETHARGKESASTYGLVFGFCAMMLLDVTLGG